MATAKLWWNGSSWKTSSAYCVNESKAGNRQLGVKHKIMIVAYDNATIKMSQSFESYQTEPIYFNHGLSTTDVTVKSGSTTIGTGAFSDKTVTSYTSFTYSGTASSFGVENYNTYRSGAITFSGSISITNPFKTLTYNANGGSGAPSQLKTTPGTVTLSSTKPTRTGYSFLGWSTSNTATTASYSAGGSYNLTANVTLYAVWKATQYTLTKSVPASASLTVKKNGSTYTGSSIAYDDVLTFTFSPSAGYFISSAKLNGTTISSGATHTVRSNVSIVITTVAAYSTITSYDSSVKTQETFHLTVNRYNPSHWNKVRYYDNSNRLLYTSPVFETDTSVTVPRTWFNNYGTVTSITVKAVNTTYTDYECTTQTGLTDERTFTVTADSGMKPVLDAGCITLTPYNTGTGIANLTNPGYVKAYSKVRAVFDTSKITHAAGASVSTYAIKVQDISTSGSGTTLTSSNKLTAVGAQTVTYTVTDTRGRTATGTETIVVNDYTNPVVSSLVCNRTDSSGIIDENESYMTVTAVANFTALSDNAVTLEVFAKPLNGSYTSYGNISNATPETFGGAFAPDTSYVVKVTVADTVGNSAFLEIKMPRRDWIFHMRQSLGGPGAAFGKVTENDYALQLANGWKFMMDDTVMTEADLEYLLDIDSVINNKVSNKVSKSGDTMTGLLTQASSASTGIYLKNNAMERGVTPASALYKYITFKDKNDADLAVIYSRINTSGNIALRVGAHVGDTYNTVSFTVNPSTSARSIAVDDADAWRSALGLGTSGALPITVAQGGSGQTAVTKTTTLSSICTAASGVTISTHQYAQWGKVAMVRLVMSKSSAVSGNNVTWATMVSGKRPAYLTGGACTSDGNTITYCEITTGGVIETNGPLAANKNLYFTCIYLLA